MIGFVTFYTSAADFLVFHTIILLHAQKSSNIYFFSFLATSTTTSTMITLGEPLSLSLPCSTTAGLLANVPPPLYSAVTPDSSPVRGQTTVQSLSGMLSAEGMSSAPNSMVDPAATSGSQDSSLSMSSFGISCNLMPQVVVDLVALRVVCCMCLTVFVQTFLLPVHLLLQCFSLDFKSKNFSCLALIYYSICKEHRQHLCLKLNFPMI